MNIDDQIANLKKALGTFKDLQKTQEETLAGANKAIDDMEDDKDKDWLRASLKSAQDGTLTSEEFLKQMKERGYGG